VAGLGGGAVWLAHRTHHGVGKLPQSPPKAAPALTQVEVCDSCAHDYNPLAPVGPKTQHPDEVGLAIDGNRNTAWTTEQYYDGLQKAGVGIYIDAKPGVAARELVIDTATPGYNVVIYGRSGLPNPDVWDPGVPGGWFKVGSANNIHATQQIKLDTGGALYRYYLVWITSLGNHNQVAVNEIALYK
jgi:serine/threonine-protein kinase